MMKEINNEQYREINNLLSITQGDLFYMIGEDILPKKYPHKMRGYIPLHYKMRGYIPPHFYRRYEVDNYEKAVGEGKRWFQETKEGLYDLICRKWNFCQKRRQIEFQNNVVLVIAIADLISGLALKVSPFIIAALLVKKGLNKFCGCKD